MSSKKKKVLDNKFKINEQFTLIKNILNSLTQILEIFNPILEAFYLMEEAKIYSKDGTLDKLSHFLFELTRDCKKLIDPSFNSELYTILNNLDMSN